MAETKLTTTLDVTVLDSAGNETTLKLNNPKPAENLSMSVIREAFSSLFAGGTHNRSGKNIVQSRAGYPFVSVQNASTVETTVVKTAIE